MAVYPDVAKKTNTERRVSVQITLDGKGEAISAKAVSGYMILRKACEEAAFNSKFKPTLFRNQAVKATAFINYTLIRQNDNQLFG